MGRRWLAAGGGWRPGMMSWYGQNFGRVVGQGKLPSEWRCESAYGFITGWPASAVAFGGWPDLRDPATRGAAVEAGREWWGDAETYAKIEDSLWTKKRDGDGRRWLVITGDGRGIAVGDSEAEALCAALEAAPHPA